MRTSSKTVFRSIFILIALALATSESTAEFPRIWKDVNYAGDNLRGHRMDIYLPPGKGPHPVVVSIAGSAWFSNNTKDRAFENAKPLMDQGFAIAAVNHRSSHGAVFPAQIQDIKGAIRFLRANADIYNLSTNFIGIMGDSSGGHLAALAATTGGVATFSVGKTTLFLEGRVGGNTEFSSRVDAVVDWYGPTTFQKMDGCGSRMIHDESNSPESVLVGGPIQSNGEMCALADPITYIDESDPPFLILHGDSDRLVPHCQSVLLHDALTKKGVKSELVTVAGGGHGTGMWVEPYLGKMGAFFFAVKNTEAIAARYREKIMTISPPPTNAASSTREN